MNTLYTLFYDSLVAGLTKHAADQSETDPSVAKGRKGVGAAAGVGTAAAVFAGSRAGKLKKVETLGSEISRKRVMVRNALVRSNNKVRGKVPGEILKVPGKVKVPAGTLRSAARAIPAGLAAAYVAKKGYDAYRGAKKD